MCPTYRSRVDTDYPFLGLGISASAREAESIAQALVRGDADHLPAIDFLNVGVSTMEPPATGLGALLRQASLESVAHLEEVNLVGHLDQERLRRVLDACEALEPRWLQEDLGIWLWRDGALGNQMLAPILDDRSLAQATANLETVLRFSRFPFLIENPPFYCVVGDMDLLSFMTTLSERTGCGLLIDIGHLVGYCSCVGRDPLPYLSEWTAHDKVVEVHLAGYALHRTGMGAIWDDAHHLPVQALALELLDYIIARSRNVKAVTLEVEGAPLDVLQQNVRRVASRLQRAEVGPDA